MRINNLAMQSPGDIYYSDDFRRVVESYIPMMLKRSDTVEIQLDPHNVYKHEFDFYGLLGVTGIPEQFRWIVMRMNGIYSPTDFPSTISSVFVPSEGFIEKIKMIHSGMMKKLNA